MRPHPIERLTWAIVNNREYFPRKKPNRLSVVVYAPEKEVFPVPCKVEHINLVRELEGIYGYQPSLIVPSHIDIQNIYKPGIIRILTGISGFEEKLGVTHNHKDLVRAHERVLNFVKNGEIPYSKIEEIIDHRYSVQAKCSCDETLKNHLAEK